MKIYLTVTFFTVLICLICIPNIYAQVSVLGELSHDREARLGESYTGSVTIRNETNEPQEAKIYQTDYTFQSNGTNNYGDPGSNPRSNSGWLAFSPSYVMLPPQGTTIVNYTVTVPKTSAGKTTSGTYWSMLMVEGIKKGSSESTLPQKNQKAQMGISQTIRYGIQIATSIMNTGSKKVQFNNVNLIKKDDGKRVFQIDIENVGEIGVRPEMYLELFNEQGASLGRLPGTKYRIYPGTSVRQNIDVTSVAPGTYKALVVIDAGGEDIFGAQYTLIF